MAVTPVVVPTAPIVLAGQNGGSSEELSPAVAGALGLFCVMVAVGVLGLVFCSLLDSRREAEDWLMGLMLGAVGALFAVAGAFLIAGAL